MDNDTVKIEVEGLAEALVLMEPTDMPALATIHTTLQGVQQWAAESDHPGTATAMAGCADLVEQIVLQEVSDPAKALEIICKAVTALQSVVRDGRPEAEADYPVEVRGSGTSEEAAPDAAPGGFVMSPLVDDKILGDFVARQPSVLEEMEELVLSLEHGGNGDNVAALRRLIHTLKGEAGLVGFQGVERVCHVAEDAMRDVPVQQLTDVLLGLKDWLGRVFDAFSGKGAVPESEASLLERLEAVRTGEVVAAEPAVPAEPAEEAQEAPPEDDQPPEVYLTGDPDLLGEFVTEASEHLDNADVHLLTVETDPKNEESLNAVFRAFHTIKGVAGFLDLGDVQRLAHEAENLLDRARKGEMELTGVRMDVTFESVDTMKRMIQSVAQSLSTREPLPHEAGLNSLIERLKDAVAGKIQPTPAATAPAQPGARVGDILVAQGKVTVEDVESAVAKQAETGQDPLGELLVREVLISRSQLQQALDAQRDEGGTRKIGEVLVGLGMVSVDDINRVLGKQGQAAPPKMGELLVREGKAGAADVAQALRAQTAPSAAVPQKQHAVEVREALRVDAERLDRLNDLIGELVIAESMVVQSPEITKTASNQLRRQLSQLDKITRELQEMSTSLRMVPVRATFQKMARLVRDLGKKSGKEVEFEMVGEDTELDKTVVEKIGDPLVHMIRNSVDHGLEDNPADRTAAGKPPTGRVVLRAYHKGGNIHIEISDDGRGLNKEAILSKALERGIIRDNDDLSDREIYNLIFEPGFSTAKKITDVSGRGVGMDVVRRNIESLRGQVDIASEVGRGTTFTIRLPLTLAIIDGMVIRVGDERYILPTLTVVRSVKPESENLFTVVGEGEMLTLQGQLIPLFRLDRIFGIKGAIQDPLKALVVIVEDDGHHSGLLIDELLGQQQIVIKPLGESMLGIPGISGGAIMSDGKVGLIIDVGGLVKLAGEGTVV